MFWEAKARTWRWNSMAPNAAWTAAMCSGWIVMLVPGGVAAKSFNSALWEKVGGRLVSWLMDLPFDTWGWLRAGLDKRAWFNFRRCTNDAQA